MTASAPERLRCMVLATWYPSDADPVDGVFVREGAPCPRAPLRRRGAPCRAGRRPPARAALAIALEDGLRTVRVGFPPLPTAQASLPLRLLALRAGYAGSSPPAFVPT